MKYENFVLNSERKANVVGKGMTRKILAFSKGRCSVSCTLKKAVGTLHSHHEQISYVVSGAFEFDINGVKKIVRAGDSLSRTHVVHGAVCLGGGASGFSVRCGRFPQGTGFVIHSGLVAFKPEASHHPCRENS